MYEKGFDLLKSNQFEEARTYFENYLRRNSANREKLLYGKARALIGLKQYDNAHGILSHLIQIMPEWIPPYLTLARMSEDLHFFALAEFMYRKALSIEPENQKVKDHYQFFLSRYVNEDKDQYVQACRVYIPGYIHLQEETAPDEEAIVEKGIEWFVKSPYCK